MAGRLLLISVGASQKGLNATMRDNDWFLTLNQNQSGSTSLRGSELIAHDSAASLGLSFLYSALRRNPRIVLRTTLRVKMQNIIPMSAETSCNPEHRFF
jgi:hypothetical protein